MSGCVPPPVDVSYRWANELDDVLSIRARQSNAADISLIMECLPHAEEDVEYHATRLGVKIGISRGRALMLCDVALMLERLPAIADFMKARRCFAFAYLHAISNATYAVSAEQLPHVEQDILNYLHPARDLQAIPGLRTFKRTLNEIVAAHDSLGVYDEEEQRRATAAEEVSYVAAEDDRFASIVATLHKDRACEFMKIVAGIRQSEAKAGRACTWGDALMHLARGTATTHVVLNIYRHADGGALWLDGAGWLSDIATAEWVERATHIRVSGDSSTSGYSPTEAQVARVRGRDGTCRFPGCTIPADQCDIDHIQPYCHENPAAGGPTDTENLHALCRRHHNLKTHHLWEIAIHADGTETWSSHDTSVTAISVPTGPLAGFGRQTFDQRLTRKTKTIRDLNERLHRESKEVLDATRDTDEDTPPF